MNLAEFKNECEGAPYDDAELAGIAAQIEGHELGVIASRYLAAMNDFCEALKQIGFERG